MPASRRHLERHRSDHIGWLRASVPGANDGLVSTTSLMAGVGARARGAGVVTGATRVTL